MDGEGARILLVDDDAFVRDMMAMILESEGYLVETACNGAEALKHYDREALFKLIITDMNMPEMNGAELIRALRARGQAVPVIILTGDDQQSRDQELSSSHSLVKDENIQETLPQAVARVLQAHSRQSSGTGILDSQGTPV